MAPTHEGLPGGLDSPLALGERCACGNIFMTDAIFCRKCGCRRGCQDTEDNEQVNRWDLFLEFNQGSLSSKIDEPRTLEIAYSPGGQVAHEIVYEDPTETEKRPRLLVSLQSVLALKALCEREFERVEIITEVLKKCRIAYYKELCYLREQLYRVGRPAARVDHLYNFEVYWYEPPEYIDHDLKEFLQECVRMNNKQLIEENYDLIQKLKALGGNVYGTTSDDDHIKRMIRTLGPGTTVRKLYGFLSTAEYGSEQKRKDFEIAVKEILKRAGKSLGDADTEKMDADLRRLEKENERLKKAAEENEEFKKRISELEKEMTALGRGGQQASMTADKEKARADEAQAKLESLESEMEKMKIEVLGVKKLSQRIDQVAQKLDATAKPKGAGQGVLGPIESSVSALEACTISGGSIDIERLQKEAKRLKEERDAEALAAARATAKLAGGDSEAEIARLKAALEKTEKDYYAKFKSLEAQLQEAEDKNKKLNGDNSDEALAQMAEKYERAQMKISELKDEIRRLKMKLGESADDDSDSDDSNYDGEMPMFLMSYVKRTKSLFKPRWQHLSEDARFSRQKRDFLFAQAHPNTSTKESLDEEESSSEAAQKAFSFLRQRAERRSLSVTQKSPARQMPVRSKTISFATNSDPVSNALRAQRTASSEYLQDPEVLQLASEKTGVHMDKFTSIASNFKQRPSLAAAVAISASELGRPGTAPGNGEGNKLSRASKKTSISISDECFPGAGDSLENSEAPQRVLVHNGCPESSETVVPSVHETYESLLNIAGQEPSGSAGLPSKGRVVTPPQREVPYSTFPAPMIIQSAESGIEPLAGDTPSSATLRSYARGRVENIEKLSRAVSAGSLSSESPARGKNSVDHFPETTDSRQGTPLGRARTRTPQRQQRSAEESQGSSQLPISPEMRSRASLATQSSQVSAPSPNQAEAGRQVQGSSSALMATEIRSRAEPATYGSQAPAFLQSQRNAESRRVSPAPSSQSLGLAQKRAEVDNSDSPLLPSFQRGRGLREDASESMVEQSSKRYDAALEAVEIGTLASMLSPAKARPTQPKKSSDNFLAEASTSSVGSTALPAEFSIASSFASSPSWEKQPQKRAPQRLPAKTSMPQGSRSLLSCATPPAGAGRSQPFPPISSPGNLEFGSGPAGFSPPLGRDSSLERGSQEKLPGRASPKALKPKRVSTAGELPQHREISWGMSISKSLGSLPFTNVKSANTTMSTTSSSFSPSKSKQRPDTGADDSNSKGHLPLLMQNFKPGKVHKGPLGSSATFYVASI